MDAPLPDKTLCKLASLTVNRVAPNLRDFYRSSAGYHEQA